MFCSLGNSALIRVGLCCRARCGETTGALRVCRMSFSLSPLCRSPNCDRGDRLPHERLHHPKSPQQVPLARHGGAARTPGGLAMPFRLVVKLAALTLACWTSIGAAFAETRIALVISNSNYAAVPSLSNPANDARAIADFLKAAGFQVLQASDLKQSAMLMTIGAFADLVADRGPDTVALVFYAGHGLQVDGENYLVPVDAVIERKADVPLQAMGLADMMNTLSSVRVKTLLVMLDACRNNPFAEVKKTGGRGLAIVDAPSGSLVSYSTAPGTEAQDGDGRNSPYTAALVKVAREEGLPIERALKRVRLMVSEATGKQQLPWESSSLTSEFSFFPGARENAGSMAVASAAVAGAPGEATSATRSLESWTSELKDLSPRAAYETVIREDKLEAYAAYLLLFPSDPLAATVRRVLERREEMVAWNRAVTANTPESYETFLTQHGDSDYAPTAKRLRERPRVMKRAVLVPGTTNPETIVDTRVVTPVYDPPSYHRLHWRHRPRDHERPAGAGRHNKPGKVAKSVRPTRLARAAHRANAAMLSRPTRLAKMAWPAPHAMNRPTMMRAMNMGARPSFGRGGGGGRR